MLGVVRGSKARVSQTLWPAEVDEHLQLVGRFRANCANFTGGGRGQTCAPTLRPTVPPPPGCRGGSMRRSWQAGLPQKHSPTHGVWRGGGGGRSGMGVGVGGLDEAGAWRMWGLCSVGMGSVVHGDGRTGCGDGGGWMWRRRPPRQVLFRSRAELRGQQLLQEALAERLSATAAALLPAPADSAAAAETAFRCAALGRSPPLPPAAVRLRRSVASHCCHCKVSMSVDGSMSSGHVAGKRSNPIDLVHLDMCNICWQDTPEAPGWVAGQGLGNHTTHVGTNSRGSMLGVISGRRPPNSAQSFQAWANVCPTRIASWSNLCGFVRSVPITTPHWPILVEFGDRPQESDSATICCVISQSLSGGSSGGEYRRALFEYLFATPAARRGRTLSADPVHFQRHTPWRDFVGCVDGGALGWRGPWAGVRVPCCRHAPTAAWAGVRVGEAAHPLAHMGRRLVGSVPSSGSRAHAPPPPLPE